MHLAEALGWTGVLPGQNGQWLGYSPHDGAYQLVPDAMALIADVRERLAPAPAAQAAKSPALAHVLQQLYDSELNFELSCFWDAGFEWAVMVQAREPEYIRGHAKTAAEALLGIANAAARQYPGSDFARWWAEAGPAQ